MIKFIIYLFVIPIIIYSLDSINMNNIFKKNRIYQARIFYILLVFVSSYLDKASLIMLAPIVKSKTKAIQ